ncbi:MAG: Histidinol-phosphatase [Alphaproteobacteria bacterium MarineAlpha4_Bin2]|nr:MAG: Histidinol-phosphatase [Alphaproteobacteria bacterium MarineAlpha4_Bin2]
MTADCPSEFVNLATRLSNTARTIAKTYFRRRFEVETKDDASPVTVADRAIEAAQRRAIEATFPDHGISGEEYGDIRLDAELVWVLDPIDGTKAFLNGIPVFTNLIGLLRNGEPILGVIDQPTIGERWIGASGRGATLNGNPVKTATKSELGEITVHATTPEMFQPGVHLERFERLAAAAKYRRYGTDCYAYGLLASGHLHLVAEADMKVQDYLPVVEVVRQAGGMITDWVGQPLGFSSDGTVLATANTTLHRQALEALAD